VLLGSVTSRILHDCACPVWTARHEDAQRPGWHTAIQNVLCAVDLKAENIHVLNMARQVAAASGAHLRIVHAVVIPGLSQAASLATAFGDALQESAHEQIDALQEKAGTRCKVSIDLGPVDTVIRRAAEASGADLVVIGRGGLQGPLGRLRSNVSGIIHQSPCAVLSV
jgi:nucleotide-binding universal stress UspA family protein